MALPEVALPEEWAHQFACWAAQRLGRVCPGVKDALPEAGALEARSSLSSPRIFLLFLALAEPREALQSVLEQGELLTAQVVTQ